jgi:hypothetical protein
MPHPCEMREAGRNVQREASGVTPTTQSIMNIYVVFDAGDRLSACGSAPYLRVVILELNGD